MYIYTVIYNVHTKIFFNKFSVSMIFWIKYMYMYEIQYTDTSTSSS